MMQDDMVRTVPPFWMEENGMMLPAMERNTGFVNRNVNRIFEFIEGRGMTECKMKPRHSC